MFSMEVKGTRNLCKVLYDCSLAYEDGDLGIRARGRSLKFFLRHSLESDSFELKNVGFEEER